MKNATDALEVVEASVTILVDNTIMELIPWSKMISRLSKPGSNFIAEHGFAALLEVEDKAILIDTGATGVALEHNLTLIGRAIEDIDALFFSHGHNDHTGGLHKFKGKIYAHPLAFKQRYLVPKEGISYELTSPKIDPEKHSTEFHQEPIKLAKGVVTTGEVPRIHEWEELNIFRMKKDGELVDDKVLDDQGVAINTREGLVVIAGCSHAGIINTIEQAVKVTGVNNIYCVIGGFHLIGPGEAKIERTISELKRLKVRKIVPIHCTGFEAIKRISMAMPDEFEYCTTGCKLTF